MIEMEISSKNLGNYIGQGLLIASVSGTVVSRRNFFMKTLI